jgi:hypothetical protein
MDWLGRIAKVRQWTRNGTRAPHKPLLLLHALGRFQQDADSELRYSAVEEDLQRLLTEYGPPNRTTPAYPVDGQIVVGLRQRRRVHRWDVLQPGPTGAKQTVRLSPCQGVRKLLWGHPRRPQQRAGDLTSPAC